MASFDSADHTHFRAAARKPVSLAGAIRASELSWNREVRVVDLGLGGARVEAPEPIETGTPIQLVIETPHLWDPLTLGGAVAWARPIAVGDGGGAEIGVKFEHESGASVRTLTELLEAEAFA